MDKLKPCPFCGELCDGVEKVGAGWYVAICWKCRAHGPHALKPEEALKLWNRRANNGLDKPESGD